MATDKRRLPGKGAGQPVSSFLQQLSRVPARAGGQGARGRLLFAMDATASRERTWDQAMHIQSQMFETTSTLGGLDVQLCYYRGYAEFEASAWCSSAAEMLTAMSGVQCRAGQTQIGRILEHALDETRRRKVNAVVFIGDSMEEDLQTLGVAAGELGIMGVPLFIFHEGGDPSVARAFQWLARRSGGAVCPFTADSAAVLRELLRAVAVYAVGGKPALQDFSASSGAPVHSLLQQLDGK